MAVFTSWAAALQQAKDELVSRTLTVESYTTPDGRSTKVRSLEELRTLIGWLEDKAAQESASSGTATRRAQGRPDSGGNW